MLTPVQPNAMKQFGPDFPSKMAGVLLPAVAVVAAGVLIWKQPLVTGPVLFLGALVVVYAIRSYRDVRVDISRESLRIQTPLRRFVTPWVNVEDLRFGDGITVYCRDRRPFHTSLYSEMLVQQRWARFIGPARRRVERQRVLQEAIIDAWRSRSDGSGMHESDTKLRITPSRIVALAATAAVVELLVVLL